MITQKNYFEHIKRLGFENLPEELKKAHLVLMTKTDMGNKWNVCDKNKELKELANIAFQKLEEFIKSKFKNKSLEGVTKHLTPEIAAIKFITPYIEKGDTLSLHPKFKQSVNTDDYSAHIEGENVVVTSIYGENIHEVFPLNDIIHKIATPSEKKSNKKLKKKDCIEVKFFRLMLYWNGKNVTKSMLLKQIETLQSDIINKRIRKSSPFAEEIVFLQQGLIDIYNNMKIHYVKFQLKDETVRKLKEAIKKFYTYDYTDSDNSDPAQVAPFDLQGIEKNIQTENSQEQLSEKQNADGNMMNSMDFAKLKFETIGLKDKWLSLIGDPCRGFSVMVFGLPKTGKSYLCVDFAGYLARNHGTVLYVAREEKLDATLQKKLNDKDVSHPNLIVSDFLPDDISKYDFIFIDSVNKLKLSPLDIEKLRTDYPGKTFIFVFQTTKEGQFRGTNEFQHDIDVIIEVPEKGKAVQYGRFNQGGKMDIFENVEEVNKKENEELSGVKNMKTKKEPKYPSWVTPEHLSEKDHDDLKEVFALYKKGDLNKAYSFASTLDTIVRDLIPADIWVEFGGKLTKAGEEDLKQIKKNKKQDTQNSLYTDTYKYEAENPHLIIKGTHVLDNSGKERTIVDVSDKTLLLDGDKDWVNISSVKFSRGDNYENRSDELNPNYLFSGKFTNLLVEALRGDFDLKYFIRRELANRGFDENGKWVGFEQAKKIHNIE
ncbi:MAG: hypothetical protein WC223_05030 [Bacteroidales bacterium]|jgi:hypothetical protein